MPAPSRKLTPLAGASKPPLQPPILRPKQLALPAARGADVRVDLPADSKLAEGPEPPPSREVPEGLAAPPHGTTPSMPPASDEDTSVDRTDTAGDESPVNKGSGENDPPSSLVQGGSSTDPAGAEAVSPAQPPSCAAPLTSAARDDDLVPQSVESSRGNPLSSSPGAAATVDPTE